MPVANAKKSEKKEEKKSNLPKSKQTEKLNADEKYEVTGTGKNKHIAEGQKIDVDGLMAEKLVKKGAVVLK